MYLVTAEEGKKVITKTIEIFFISGTCRGAAFLGIRRIRRAAGSGFRVEQCVICMLNPHKFLLSSWLQIRKIKERVSEDE